MPTAIENMISMRRVRRSARAVLLAIAFVAIVTNGRADADALSDGAKNYQPYVVEHIGIALAGARKLQAAVKAGDTKAAQAAWVESRKGWEAMEPVTAEYFGNLDKLIDAWPDAKQGYHAIEAALFSGKLEGLSEPVSALVVNLDKFEKRVSAKNFKFTPQGLLNGVANLAYEVGEEKSKGGESPYAGTSIIDMQENVEGIEVVYTLVFEAALKKSDPALAKLIDERIEKLEGLVKVQDIKSMDQKAVHVAGEELAVLLQSAALKLKLKKPKVGD